MSTNRFKFLKEYLEKRKKQKLLRVLSKATISKSRISLLTKSSLVNLSSNDYLGLSKIRHFPDKQIECSSRLVAGNSPSHYNLERFLAQHKAKQSALVFPTGYMANIGTIPSIVQKKDIILSDELNHASIIQSCKLADAKVIVYKHNDVKDLDEKLDYYGKNHSKMFVITEGVFSMDGDLAKLREISKLVREKRSQSRYKRLNKTKNTNDDYGDIITVLDDAHGDFVFAKDGKGVHKHLGVSKLVDVYISSLSKGLGSFGGYVAGPKILMDFLVNASKPFIYTSALPSVLCENAVEKLRQTKTREKMRQKLWSNTFYIRKCLEEIGYSIRGESQIIPIIIGEEKKALQFGQYLYKNGIYAQPIRYPTVPRGQARLRLSSTALLDKKDLELTATVLERAAKKFNLV